MPILWSHGIFGGHDNVRELVDRWIGDGVRAIGPSRLGYLGSTMPADATPVGQADAFVSLLDHVGVARAVAVGYSAGSPGAVQLALRHPERLDGLILAAAHLPGSPPLTRPVRMALPLALRWEWGLWFLKTYRPGLLARIMGVPKGWRPTIDEQRFIDGLQESFFPTKPKQLGVVFDSLVSEPACNTFPLEGIGVPTLIVHAPDDPLAHYEHAIKAAARIRGAQLVTIDGGGHLFLGHEADGAQSNVVVRPTGRHRPNPRVPVPRRALYPGGGVGVRLGGVVQEWRVRR